MKLFAAFLVFSLESIIRGNGEEIQKRQFIPNLVCFQQRPGVNCAKCKTAETCVSDTNPEVRLYLFTRRNKNEPEFLHDCGGMLPRDTYYIPSAPSVIVIHGHLDSPCLSSVHREIKDQLLCRGSYNVVLVDCSRVFPVRYVEAVKNVDAVGRIIACVIKNIRASQGVGKNMFHIVGHSLGAHVAGMVGQYEPCLRRITGVDTAGPGFIGKPPEKRLDRGDAELVDIIHTNGGDCLPHLGDPTPHGHLDFYFNGGSIQQSCISNIIPAFLKLDFATGLGSLEINSCSHMQAMEYLKISINPCKCEFVGIECESYEAFKSGSCKKVCNEKLSNCAVAGMGLEDYGYQKGNASRKYYIETRFVCPYCDNNGIQLNNFMKNAKSKGCLEHCCAISSDGKSVI